MKNKSLSMLFISATIILSSALMISAASAASLPGQKPAVRGTVTGINGTNLTVSNASGTVYTVDASNAAISKGYAGLNATTTTISAIEIGNQVIVIGTISGTSITATSIHVGVGLSNRGGKKPGTTINKPVTILGTVSSVNGASISLSAKNGNFTVDATGAKIIRRFGAAMQVADIQVGDNLQVEGRVNSTTTVTAKTIRDLSLQAKNGTFTGTVSSINGASFIMKTGKRGQQTINTDSNTIFKKNNQTASSSDLTVGAQIMVNGVWDRTNKNVTAKTVNIIIRIVPISINGILQSINGNALTVTGNNNTTYTVDASKAKFTYKGGRKGDLSILQANDKVQVVGKHLNGSNDVNANMVRDLSKTYIKPATGSSTPTSTPQ